MEDPRAGRGDLASCVATSPLLDGVGGRYFEDCNEAASTEPGTRAGVAAYALDPATPQRLWEVSLELVSA